MQSLNNTFKLNNYELLTTDKQERLKQFNELHELHSFLSIPEKQ